LEHTKVNQEESEEENWGREGRTNMKRARQEENKLC